MSFPYFDTSVALQLVVEGPLSGKVRSFLATRKFPVPFSRLMELEIENALHALRFRDVIRADQRAAARDLVTTLLERGRFLPLELSLDRIATEALSLSPLVTNRTGCRTLDLMHVATAKLLKAMAFISTDRRQLEAAQICGLEAINLED